MKSDGRKTIAIMLPGETFSSTWVAGWTMLFAEIFNRFHVAPIFCFSSNVYVTRGTMLAKVLAADEQENFDYVLWLDDDNVLAYAQFERLLKDLDENPYLDAVAAWCWIQPDSYAINAIPSCGMMNGNKSVPLGIQQLCEVDGVPPEGDDLVRVDYTGFPAVLMRFDAIRQMSAYKHPFAPYNADDVEAGFLGEDVSFWLRAGNMGLTLAVDRKVKVPHFKLRAAEPVAVADPCAVAV